MDYKDKIATLIKKETGIDASGLLEVPPNPELGDYAFPCFVLAKKYKKAPNQIAEDLAVKLKAPFISEVKAVGPYVNFKIKSGNLAESVLSVISEKMKIGNAKDVICIESPGPNTNKPLHLGHVRNMLLGVSLRKVLERVGNKVISVDIVNDRGVHICKSMLAYKLHGKNKTPESEKKKGDHFVGDYYVIYAKESEKNPEMENEVKDMLVKWENDDKETKTLWKKMRDWCLKGFKETYKDFKVKIDKTYYESDIYLEGKQIILDGYKRKMFDKDEDGAIFVDLSKINLDKKVLLRADGTSIYITQDIALANIRFKDFHMDRMVYVVGNEQNYHFKALFEVLKKLKYPFADKCYHLSYGMVNLPEGKMKSREGTVVDADDFRRDMISIALREVKERYPKLSKAEAEKRAEMIAVGAMNFFILKYDPVKDFVYDPKKSISFQGETGPYVQYAHARICSIIEKAGRMIPSKIDYSKLGEKAETNLISVLGRYSEIVQNAADNNRSSTIANYLTELAQAFTSYYHETQIIIDDKDLMNARLFLIDKTRIILKDGLSLLGIEAPEEM